MSLLVTADQKHGSTNRTGRVLRFRPEAKQVQKRTSEWNGFIAEFFTNNQVEPPIHHYVVMRKGSVEILAWGQERSEEEADRAARNCIDNLSRRASATG